jgi:hypothetical protein
MAQCEQPDKNPEETEVDKDELTPEDLDDIAGGTKPRPYQGVFTE